MNKFLIFWLVLFSVLFGANALAQEVIELDATIIKGNAELPKYMYVVPWQDRKSKQNNEKKLVLHNLYVDVFDPVMPDYIPRSEFSMPEAVVK